MSKENKTGTRSWRFVIDTEDYAGNFERELCAYCTGQIGDCEAGDEEAEIFRNEEGKSIQKFADIIEQVPDEHGCARPCEIFPTPGWFNGGMGGHFKEETSEKVAKEHFLKETIAYYEPHIKRTQMYKDTILKGGKAAEDLIKCKWTVEGCDKEIEEFKKEIEEARKKKDCNKYEAFLSVAIHFSQKPGKELIEIMKRRAKVFASNFKEFGGIQGNGKAKPIKITGFRLVSQIIQTKQEEIEI